MKRIDTTNRSVDLFGVGKDGFRNGNKGAGIAATEFDADWCNHIQEEIANVVEGAGDVLDDADRTQLLQAINTLIANNQSIEPAGKVMWFASSSAPTGYLKANGAAISRVTYADLFTAIGTTFGAGDGVNTFNIPDLRGEFLRAWDDGRGIDSARVFGSAQLDAFQSHTHNSSATSSVSSQTVASGGIGVATAGSSTSTPTGRTATETRPRNIALLACIKY